MTRGKRRGGATRRYHDRLASYDAVSQAVSATTLTPELKSVTLSYPTFTLRQLTCSGKDKDKDKDNDKDNDNESDNENVNDNDNENENGKDKYNTKTMARV